MIVLESFDNVSNGMHRRNFRKLQEEMPTLFFVARVALALAGAARWAFVLELRARMPIFPRHRGSRTGQPWQFARYYCIGRAALLDATVDSLGRAPLLGMYLQSCKAIVFKIEVIPSFQLGNISTHCKSPNPYSDGTQASRRTGIRKIWDGGY